MSAWAHHVRRKPATLAIGVMLVTATLSTIVRPAAADDRADCIAKKRTRAGPEICRRAVAAAPKDPALRRAYAISLSYNGAYDEALTQFRAIVRLLPNDADAHYELSYFLGFKRQFKEAEPPIDRALALAPDNLKFLKFAAIIYANNRHETKRYAVVARAAERGDVISMYERATLHLQGVGTARDLAAGVNWLTRAANAGHVMAMDDLAEAYLNGKLGLTRDRAAAARWARRAHKARHGE